MRGQEYLSAYMDYMTMVKNSGYEIPDTTPLEFLRHPIFTFLLEPVQHGHVQSQAMKGPVSVSVRFAKALKKSVNLMLYAEMPGLMRIDATRNVAIS